MTSYPLVGADEAYEGDRSGETVGSSQHFSLIHALVNAFNKSSTSSLNGNIAKYFLENLDRLEGLNIYEVAEDCFTSRSGIRRFAQSIGFDNFTDIKDHGWEFELHRRFFESYANHGDYRSYLMRRIITMLEDINGSVSEEILEELALRIHDARKVVLVGSDFLAMSVREFQHQMLVMHKLIYILTDSEGDVDGLSQLDEGDLVIVISVTGNYAKAVSAELSDVRATRVLLTQNTSFDLPGVFDWTLYISQAAHERGNTVYAEYGIRYFCDLLYNCYFRLFEEDRKENRA